MRLFKFTLASVALPALLVAMFCTESVVNTLVFGNINGCILLLEVLFFRWLLDGKVNHQWWAGRGDRTVAGGQTASGAAAVAAAAEPAVAAPVIAAISGVRWRSTSRHGRWSATR